MYPGVHSRLAPDRVAAQILETGERLTYAELDERSARLARALHDRGLRRGEVIAFVSDNRLECLEIYWAAIRSGLIVTPINWHLGAADVLGILRDCDARAVFLADALADLADEVAAGCGELALRCALGGARPGWEDYEAVVAAAGPRLTAEPRGVEMLYSSGTTGRPKGIEPVMPDRGVAEPGEPLVMLAEQRFGIGPDDVYLSPAPLYHAAPLRWAAAVQALGGTVVLMRRFDAERALDAIARLGVTVTQMVPTMFHRLLQLPDQIRARHDVSSLRLALHAGAPCPEVVKRSMIAWWGEIVEEYYGNSEGNTLTFISAGEWLERPGSVGRSYLGTIHVVGPDGVDLPAGEIGEIYVERDVMPFCYHNDPERTRAAQHPQHPTWTTVGDVGSLDPDGYLYLTGRTSFMIISGGVNIHPQEVEDAVLTHPDVADAAVVGVPDADLGEKVAAFVALRPGVAATEAEAERIRVHVEGRVARFKAPRMVCFIDAVPRTVAGKLSRTALLDDYADRRAASAEPARR